MCFVRSAEDEYAVSLANLLRIFRERLWAIALVAIVFTAGAVGFSLLQTPRYQATATILVSQEPSEEGTSSLGSEIAGVQSLVQTVTAAVSSRPIAEEVIEGLNLEMEPPTLLENLDVAAIPDTQFIEISYTDSDPQRAREIANAIGIESSNRVSEVSAEAITADIWESAVVPEAPISPTPTRNGILALGLGLMLGVGLSIVLEFMDESWRSPGEVEAVSELSVFGAIPEFGASKGKNKTPNEGSRQNG